jgi:hypothetical protein
MTDNTKETSMSEPKSGYLYPDSAGFDAACALLRVDPARVTRIEVCFGWGEGAVVSAQVTIAPDRATLAGLVDALREGYSA